MHVRSKERRDGWTPANAAVGEGAVAARYRQLSGSSDGAGLDAPCLGYANHSQDFNRRTYGGCTAAEALPARGRQGIQDRTDDDDIQDYCRGVLERVHGL